MSCSRLFIWKMVGQDLKARILEPGRAWTHTLKHYTMLLFKGSSTWDRLWTIDKISLGIKWVGRAFRVNMFYLGNQEIIGFDWIGTYRKVKVSCFKLNFWKIWKKWDNSYNTEKYFAKSMQISLLQRNSAPMCWFF